MSAKITLVGAPQSLHIENGIATYRLVTGPASNTAPKGLPLFKAVTYVVKCSERQYRRGRVDDHDHSDLIVEGYLEPRVDEQGQPYVAVIATNVVSQQAQNEKKFVQIRDDFVKAEEAYEAASAQFGEAAPQTQAALAQWESLKEGLLRFWDKHPEFKGRPLV